jgi:hypothetical protein
LFCVPVEEGGEIWHSPMSDSKSLIK